MRKIQSLLTCLLISLLLLSGCALNESSSRVYLETTPYDAINNLDGVNMKISGEVSPTALTIVMENNSDKNCLYGDYFRLEKKIEGRWYQIPVAIDGNYGFNDIGYDLPSGEVSEWEVDWEWLYGSLEPGEYRIIKDVLEFKDTGDYDTYYLAVEFSI